MRDEKAYSGPDSDAASGLAAKFSSIAAVPAIASVFPAYGWRKIIGLY